MVWRLGLHSMKVLGSNPPSGLSALSFCAGGQKKLGLVAFGDKEVIDRIPCMNTTHFPVPSLAVPFTRI